MDRRVHEPCFQSPTVCRHHVLVSAQLAWSRGNQTGHQVPGCIPNGNATKAVSSGVVLECLVFGSCVTAGYDLRHLIQLERSMSVAESSPASETLQPATASQFPVAEALRSPPRFIPQNSAVV